MALINKKVPITPQAKETATTDRTVLAEESSEMPKRKQHIKGVVPERFVLGAKDHKNIKVSEDDLDLIKSIAATRDMKVYEVIHEMLIRFAENDLNDREIKLINSLKQRRNK